MNGQPLITSDFLYMWGKLNREGAYSKFWPRRKGLDKPFTVITLRSSCEHYKIDQNRANSFNAVLLQTKRPFYKSANSSSEIAPNATGKCEKYDLKPDIKIIFG